MRLVTQTLLTAVVLATLWTSNLPAQQVVTKPVPGEATKALQHSKSSHKQLFVLVYRNEDAATQAMLGTMTQEVKRRPDAAEMGRINVQEPGEKDWVDTYKLSRAPMPLLMAFAPNGAVTGAFPMRVTPEQIKKTFVSPGMAACLLAGQQKKVVVLAVQKGIQTGIPVAVQQFANDPNFKDSTNVVAVRADDAREANLLSALKLTNKAPVLAMIGTSGGMFASLPVTATKDQLVTAIKSASSGCCPGGKCGPNGKCCPGGKCPPAGQPVSSPQTPTVGR